MCGEQLGRLASFAGWCGRVGCSSLRGSARARAVIDSTRLDRGGPDQRLMLNVSYINHPIHPERLVG